MRRMKSTRRAERDLQHLIPAWNALRDSVPFFGPIRTEREYESMFALMHELLTVVGDGEDHPLADLLEVVEVLLAQYDEEQTPERQIGL
jgi:hypothetical protein